MSTSLRFDLAGYLLDLDDHELGRLEGRKTDQDVDDTQVTIVLGRGFAVALDEVGVPRRCALECALAEEVVHERANVQTYLRPERFVVRFEDHPLGPAIEAFFHVQRQATDGYVLPFRGEAIVAL